MSGRRCLGNLHIHSVSLRSPHTLPNSTPHTIVHKRSRSVWLANIADELGNNRGRVLRHGSNHLHTASGPSRRRVAPITHHVTAVTTSITALEVEYRCRVAVGAYGMTLDNRERLST